MTPSALKTIKHLQSLSTDDLGRALDSLSDHVSPDTFDILYAFIKDSDPEVRSDAVFNLGEIKDQRAIPILISIATNEKNENVRMYAYRALGSYHHPDILECLLDAAYHEQPVRMFRMDIARGLGAYNDPRTIEALLFLLKDEDYHVLIWVVDSLFILNRPELIDVWNNLLTTSFHSYICKQALLALTALKQDPFATLSAEMENPDPSYRAGVAFALTEMGTPAAHQLVQKIIQSDADDSVQEAALYFLCDANPDAVEALLPELLEVPHSLRFKEILLEWQIVTTN